MHRGRLVGLYRSYGHALLVLRVLRPRMGRRWPWLTLAAGSFSLDAFLAHRALQTSRPLIAERTVVEALDAAVWTQATGPFPSMTRATTLVAMPTAAESGYLLGRDAVRPTPSVVVAALRPVAIVVLGQGISRRLRGWTPGWGQIGWGAIGLGIGAGLGRNRRAVRIRYRETWREYVGPRVEAAFWCAQHDVTMDEADPRSPHNLKKDLLVLETAGSTRARSARFRFSERKEAVVSLTAPFGAYLGDVVVSRSLVPADAWSVRLSPSQARDLQDRLRILDGTRNSPGWPLELLNEPEARRPGGRVELACGPERILIPEVSPPHRWLGDPAPVMFIVCAMWKLLGRAFPDHPPFLIAFTAASVDLLAAGAYKRAQPDSTEITKPVAAAFVSAALFAVPTSIWVHRRFMDNGSGEQGFPMVSGIFGFTAIAARYWDDLDRRQRLWVASGATLLLVLMWLMSARPVDIHNFVGETLSVLLPIALARGFSSRVSADSNGVWEQLRRRSEWLISDAYKRGCENELRLLKDLIDDAELAMDEAAPLLPASDCILIRQHFEEARQWLIQHSE